MQSCVCRPLWMELGQNICDITRGYSPLTLYIDFQNFQIFGDINSPFDPVHS